jgi:hypothetical protein
VVQVFLPWLDGTRRLQPDDAAGDGASADDRAAGAASGCDRQSRRDLSARVRAHESKRRSPRILRRRHLTIVIEEKTSASKKSSGNAARTGSTALSVPTVAGVPFKTFQGMEVEAANSQKFSGAAMPRATICFRATSRSP